MGGERTCPGASKSIVIKNVMVRGEGRAAAASRKNTTNGVDDRPKGGTAGGLQGGAGGGHLKKEGGEGDGS